MRDRSSNRPSSTPSFVWVESLGDPGATMALAHDESHYVARVCRARAGDAISLTDGRGGLATARVVKPAPPVVVPVVEAPRSSLRVLAVDDNTELTDGLAAILGLWGHSVRVARDGEEYCMAHLPKVGSAVQGSGE